MLAGFTWPLVFQCIGEVLVRLGRDAAYLADGDDRRNLVFDAARTKASHLHILKTHLPFRSPRLQMVDAGSRITITSESSFALRE
jgi:hypothetical protein